MSEDFDCARPFHALPSSNIATVLDLSCTSGWGQTLHPDVLYVGEHSGGGWRYVMTITGFPYSNDYYENPEFVVSDDGIHWHLPEGGASPLIDYPNHVGYCYNSDPALFFENGQYYIFYRDVRVFSDKAEVNLYFINSDDGLSWSNAHKVLSAQCSNSDTSRLLSPSVLRIDDNYVMWFVERGQNGYCVHRLVSGDLHNLSDEETIVVINGLRDKEYPWHIDVVRDGARLIMAFCTTGPKRSILFAESNDDGFTWNIFGNRIEPEKYALGGVELYKPSLCKDANNLWRLYYSAKLADGAWFSALIYLSEL